jgi:hypothetical protein
LSTRFIRRAYSARDTCAEGLVVMLAILKITVHVAVEPLSSCDNRSAFFVSFSAACCSSVGQSVAKVSSLNCWQSA